jgi:hypothetical protein
MQPAYLVAVLLAGNGIGQLPTTKQVVDGYRKNFESFGPLRVAWKVWDQHEAAYYENNRYLMTAIQAALRDRDFGKKEGVRSWLVEHEQQLRSQAEAVKEFAGKPVPVSLIVNEFWTDRESFQVRAPHKEADEFVFPDTPLRTAADLRTTFAKFRICTWSPQQKPKTWRWNGIWSEGDAPQGYVTDKTPDTAMNFCLPPLGLKNAEWGAPSSEIWHPADQLLAGPANELTVIGPDTIDDKKVIVVERKVLRKETRDGKEAVLVARSRGWLDPARGCLPLRIESVSPQYLEGEDERPRLAPSEITVVTRIDEVKGCGFYPMAGKRIFRQYDQRPAAKEDKEPGGFYTYRTAWWQVERLDHHVAAPRQMFRLGFPEGTLVFDARTELFFTVGKE